ncbi:MAG: NAD(P)/FAD-dependent oxidoreductase [Vicinamibacterales bacterium]
MPIRHIPIWLDRFPKVRRPSHPRFKGDSETHVVVVGGGLTGCACAWSFANAGIRTVLLEADTLGGAGTAESAGLLREEFDASFRDALQAQGLRASRTMWQAMRRAAQEMAAAFRRLEIRCDLAPCDFLRVARGQSETSRFLSREYQSLRDAGLDHTWVKPAALNRETAFEADGAIRTHGFSFDPYRACIGLAAAAAARGAMLYERSPVRRIRAGRKGVQISTASGTVKAEAVVIATSAPLQDLRALRRHLKVSDTYAVVTAQFPAAVRRELGSRASVVLDTETPPHMLRWLKDDRALCAGGDQPVVGDRAREKALVQRTGQLMYELSLMYPAISGLPAEWAWSSRHYESVDRLPFVGLHRNFPRHLFAIAPPRHGAAFAWLAARLLLRQYQEEPAKGDELFGFSRIL